jgi:hypothetical protein
MRTDVISSFHHFIIPALRQAQDRLTFGQAGIQRCYSKCSWVMSAQCGVFWINWIQAFAHCCPE